MDASTSEVRKNDAEVLRAVSSIIDMVKRRFTRVSQYIASRATINTALDRHIELECVVMHEATGVRTVPGLATSP